ncbi:MAG: hypothetical protein IKN41_08175 [Candidatus Methanomethylophilaceae archaeon]|nr:hypothetical protein [Candidatus Methanomethylophilaceae archaeon]
MSDILNSSTNVVIGLIVAVILICSALIPITVEQIESLTATYKDFAEIGTWTTLIEVVIIMAIIGLIIGVVKTYSRGNELD